MRRGTAGLIGAVLLVCGIAYIAGVATPAWPGVALIVVGFMVLAWSNTIGGR